MGEDSESLPAFPGSGPSRPISASIPLVPTSFVGRDAEADRIADLVVHGNPPLVTITGPAGAGKTRLALEVATRITGEFTDGPVFVPLAAVETPDLVSATILQALGETGPSLSTGLDQLRDALQHRDILLILDNLEHLPGWTADLEMLMSWCRDARFLITSQAPLGVRGERVERLPPLTLPDTSASADEIYASDAVRLFVERAQAVNPRIAANDINAGTIAALCRHLDGLPLAIELAAARSSIMNPLSILERLDHRFALVASAHKETPARQRTLHHAIGWSYDLLDADEQRMFRWLAVFSGGIPLEAVEAFPSDFAARQPLDLLEQLVDRNLVQAVMSPGVTPRYAMLESLRAFGQEQLLIAADDPDARDWHAAWFAGVVRQARAPGHPQQGAVATDRLSQEWENIRQAMGWLRSRDDATAIQEMCGGLWRFWSMRGLAAEGRDWVRYALAAAPDDGSRPRAELLEAGGYLAEDLGDLAKAECSLLAALAIYERLNDPGMVAATVSGLGCIAHDKRDYERAFAWHFRALELADASGDRRSRAIALGNLGGASYLQGDYEAAIACYDEAVEIAVELGDRQNEGLLLGNLGAYLNEINNLTAATDALERSLEIMRALDDSRSLAYSLINLGEVRLRSGEPEIARPMLTEAIDILVQGGNVQAIAIARIVLARILLAPSAISEALANLRDSLVGLRNIGDFVTAAEAMDVLAAIALAIEAIPEASRLLAGAETIRSLAGVEIRPSLEAETRATRERLNALPGNSTPGPELPFVQPDEIVGTAIRDTSSLRRRVPVPATEMVTVTSPAAGDEAQDQAATQFGLSSRELDVLRLLAQGRSTRDIAADLCISPRTVATHIGNITGKLDVRSRTAAVAMAMRLHLV